MLNSTWVRMAAGQVVRADRIVAVRLEHAEGPTTGRWADPGNVRIMACLDVAEADVEDGAGPSWWQEAAVCSRDRGDVLLVNLLNLMAAAAETSGVRFIYPVLRDDDRLDRWTAGSSLPLIEGAAVSALPQVPRGVAAGA